MNSHFMDLYITEIFEWDSQNSVTSFYNIVFDGFNVFSVRANSVPILVSFDHENKTNEEKYNNNSECVFEISI